MTRKDKGSGAVFSGEGAYTCSLEGVNSDRIKISIENGHLNKININFGDKLSRLACKCSLLVPYLRMIIMEVL